MADLETNSPSFDIEVQGEKLIRVQPDETSDGVPIYKCFSGNKMITEIRQGNEGEWEQLWGELTQEDINRIATAILNYLD